MRLLKSLSTEVSEDDGGDDSAEGSAAGKAKAKAKKKGGSGDLPFDMGDIQADPFFKELTESKIAQFAKELSSDIRPEDLGISDLGNIRSVQDAFKCLGEKPDKIMGLVQTVGEKIQGKLTSGDIRQADLMADAHQLMEKMHESPIFKQMFKAQKRGGRRKRKGSRRAANDIDPQNLMHDFASKLGIDPTELMRMSETLMADAAARKPPSRGTAGESTLDRLRSELRRRKEVATALAAASEMAGRNTTAKNEKAPASSSTTTKSKRKRKKKNGAAAAAAAEDASTNATNANTDGNAAADSAANARDDDNDDAIFESAAAEVGI